MSSFHRIATILCAVCFSMLAIGIALEATTGDLLFESYLGTFSGNGILFAIVAARTRPSRQAG